MVRARVAIRCYEGVALPGTIHIVVPVIAVVVGIIVGAFIFGLAKEAFFYIPGIDGSFYRVFLGLVIIASALLNENIRKRIMGTL